VHTVLAVSGDQSTALIIDAQVYRAIEFLTAYRKDAIAVRSPVNKSHMSIPCIWFSRLLNHPLSRMLNSNYIVSAENSNLPLIAVS
jgi:hypothetical protein